MERFSKLKADALDFAPAMVRVQDKPPSPLPRLVLYGTLALFAILVVWAEFGRLDIVAVAQGKLVPQSYLQIVQPADAGIVREILVKEGDRCAKGRCWCAWTRSISDAEGTTLTNDLHLKSLQLRRIDAELAGAPLQRLAKDPPELFAQVESQYRQRRQAYLDALGAEQALRARAEHDLGSAGEIEAKLKQTAPIYREQEKAWDQLARKAFAGQLLALDRRSARMEVEQAS